MTQEPEIPLNDDIRDFLAHKATLAFPGVPEASWKPYRGILNRFGTFIQNRGIIRLSDFTDPDLIEFLATGGHTRHTETRAILHAYLARAYLTHLFPDLMRVGALEEKSSLGALTAGYYILAPLGADHLPTLNPLGGQRYPMSDRQLVPLQEIHKTRVRLPYSKLLHLARTGVLPVRKFGKAYYGDPDEVVESLLPAKPSTPAFAQKSGRKP